MAFEVTRSQSNCDPIRLAARMERAASQLGASIRPASRIVVLAVFGASVIAAFADEPALPNSIRTSGETVLLAVHAEGAQVYECKTDSTGRLAWFFREPIATLIQNGKTVGRHYAGPQWEIADGSSVVGKVESKVDGVTPSDIPWLKLAVASHNGQGVLADATTIQRINTHGGALSGECDAVGTLRSVPYSAEYVFSRQ